MPTEPETRAEQKLWESLVKTNLSKHFVPQGKVFGYTPDFWSPKYKLAVEVDGSAHRFTKTYDLLKDADLRKRGIRVVRFKNLQVFDNPTKCIERLVGIMKAISKRRAKLIIPKWKRK